MRSIPLGILIVTAALAMIGLGAAGGGLYLLVTRDAPTPWAAIVLLVLAPATLYLAYHLYALRRWAWLALLLLTGLMLVSSLFRLALTPGLVVAPIVELVVELGLLRYLTLPRIRTRLREGSAAPVKA